MNFGQNALFSILAFGHKHGRQKNLLELKKCTVSGSKRQFDKWHLFSAPTTPPWARELGTICPFGVFSPVLSQFLAQIEANPCGEANCGVVTFSLVL